MSKGPGAYVVDTLTVPYDNPSKSYMRLTGVEKARVLTDILA